ncbi:uncharacterized protein C9orf40 homolog [Trichomycterus rosablanca]|uniref:uncharacterized protein C9orf40 homolog n=1 Tax=Trichomycterus rosablanca TaxID=2290929 RepID=UPI002F3604FE
MMSKRRAVLVDEVPRKKRCSVPDVQPDPGTVGALHCVREVPVTEPVHVHKRRKSSSCSEEETVHERQDREPPRKLTVQHKPDCTRSSGTFSALKQRSTCTRQHADTGTKPRDRTKVTRAAGDDLCEYNSFQFWRNPLPALDLTLLDDPSTPDSSLKDTAEAMET